MNSTRPVIIFDTSAVNKLIKGATDLGPEFAVITSGFDVWVTAMSVDEIIATPVSETRKTLLRGLQRVLVTGRCIWPPHEVLTLLASAHSQAPSRFNWRNVEIRAKVYERAIIERNFTDELCNIQLTEQRRVEEEFTAFWEGLRVELNPHLDTGPSKRPTSYAQAADIARQGLVLTGLGGPLYQRGSGNALDKAGLKAFMEACPPFRSVCYGLVGSWFDISLAPQVFKRRPGRNDQMMSVYLPYCRHFVTADWRQEERLRDIAKEANVECDIQSFSAFLAGF